MPGAFRYALPWVSMNWRFVSRQYSAISRLRYGAIRSPGSGRFDNVTFTCAMSDFRSTLDLHSTIYRCVWPSIANSMMASASCFGVTIWWVSTSRPASPVFSSKAFNASLRRLFSGSCFCVMAFTRHLCSMVIDVRVSWTFSFYWNMPICSNIFFVHVPRTMWTSQH